MASVSEKLSVSYALLKCTLSPLCTYEHNEQIEFCGDHRISVLLNKHLLAQNADILYGFVGSVFCLSSFFRCFSGMPPLTLHTSHVTSRMRKQEDIHGRTDGDSDTRAIDIINVGARSRLPQSFKCTYSNLGKEI